MASSAGTNSSATVQHRQPLASSTMFSSGQAAIPAAFENFAVDADVAELVDDDGEPAALCIRQHMADQRGLAGAEETGDDGAGHAGERDVHSIVLLKSEHRRHAGDQAALERLGPAAPRHQAIGRAGEQARAFDQRRPMATSSRPNT